MKEILKVGISSKHYTVACLELINKIGWKLELSHPRNYTKKATGTQYDLQIHLMNTHDIPKCVQRGYIDIGILQYSVLTEERTNVIKLIDLNFGLGEMVIAVPMNSAIKRVRDLEGRTIATRNPVLTKKYFEEIRIHVDLFVVQNGTEVFPNLSDEISGMVEYKKTGETIRENNLRIIGSIFKSSLRCVSTVETPLIKDFCLNIRNFLSAEGIPGEWLYV